MGRIWAFLLASMASMSLADDILDDLPIISDLKELPLDDEKRLADHWILFPNTDVCKNLISTIISSTYFEFRQIGAVEDSAYDAYFSDAKMSSCPAVCVERGTEPELLPYVMEDKIFLGNGEQEFRPFIEGCQKAEAGWVSYLDEVLTLYWIDSKGKRVQAGTLKKGEKNTVWLQSILGHKFELVDDSRSKLIAEFIIQHHVFNVVGEKGTMVKPTADYTRNIQETFKSEWQRSRGVKRTFTELGFDRGRLPKPLWASMSAYYYNNRYNKVREEWETKGHFVNWWEADAFMIGMPWELKKKWQAELKKLVEAWSGVELELTDIYGMRRYEDGARLLTHVDRQPTHAASLIINVAQGDIREPWKVEIYDFADRLHEITMEPGDIVYYESARCLHGRMKPLQGGFYVNLFAHYRPIGDPDWFKKPNPDDAPKPLLDIGTCTVEENATQCSKKGSSVPFLSTALETLHGPQDLFRWWQETGKVERKVAGRMMKHDEL